MEHLPCCDDFIEQREHRVMAPCVIYTNDCGGAVARTQGFVPKLVSRIQVMGELVSRRNHCA
jgi:hypothetical protein